MKSKNEESPKEQPREKREMVLIMSFETFDHTESDVALPLDKLIDFFFIEFFHLSIHPSIHPSKHSFILSFILLSLKLFGIEFLSLIIKRLTDGPIASIYLTHSFYSLTSIELPPPHPLSPARLKCCHSWTFSSTHDTSLP